VLYLATIRFSLVGMSVVPKMAVIGADAPGVVAAYFKPSRLPSASVWVMPDRCRCLAISTTH
jgi:hypothetical protein